MDDEIFKILQKKILEIKKEDDKIHQIIDEFQDADFDSFSSGIVTGRLFNSF